MVDIRCLQGNAIEPFLDALATLRIRVFRNYPYLYDGDHGYESDYLRRYAECPDSLFVLAFDGEALIGAATGMPLRAECDEFRAPFEAHGYAIERIFYYGESVLLPEYRGQGIGKAFMTERERHAAQTGYDLVAFCAVQRAEDHPARPANYRPLDGFWKSRGYQRHPELTTHFAWKDVGDSDESEKPMTFWLKSPEEERA